jgi:hypothetical protein
MKVIVKETGLVEGPNMKKYKFGYSTVIVHSKLWAMSDEEQERWIKEETEKGNPILAEIREAIKDCYINRK